MTAPAVGRVLLRGPDSREMGELRSSLKRWLARTGWERQVELVCEPLGTGDPSRGFAVEFLPGEYQSNGPWRLSYERSPEPRAVGELLQRWLETRAVAPSQS